MQLWVGLGNPGPQYAMHRHNVGFMAVDVIADMHGFGPVQKKFQGWLQEGRIGSEKILLLKPAVADLMDRSPEQFAVIEAQRNPERTLKIADYFNQLGRQQGESQLAMAAHSANLDVEAAERVREALRQAVKKQKAK